MKRMGIARAVMLLSLGMNLGIAAAWAQKWMAHWPTESDSRLETRGSPEPAAPEAPTPLGMVRYDAGRVTLDDTTFVAITTEVALPALLAALGNGYGGTLPDDGILRDERRLAAADAPAGGIVLDKDGRVVSALFAWRGSVLNQLLCIGPKGTGASAGVRRLMSSFAPVGG
ncbi:hypothetical protein FHP25_17940 [Vineibacter terrae]|uniref:Uncharacterized protein n=1 Tax=Vineibacter terrae TaxID=2586908 RepID=A0A5C8PJS4_9HYPH|nr:hypothetical protein [Vineibacter terrae]TXL74087.1 hypothetical protein FHP25_17940 [Vineibacter terrae]